MFNLAKLIYRAGVGLASKVGLYSERTEKYFQYFEQYIRKNVVVLDLGCGSGAFSEILSKNSCFVISLDVDAKTLKMFQGEASIYRVCGDAQSLPLRRDSVDVVMAISLLEHLRKPHLTINEVLRVLRPQGFFIIQLPNLQYFIEPHTKFPLLFIPETLKERIRKQLDYSYINFTVTLKETLKLVKDSFTLTQSFPIYHKLRTPPWPPAWTLILQNPRQHVRECMQKKIGREEVEVEAC